MLDLIRPSILEVTAYSSARSEYEGNANIYLDANESPYGTYNRYPDPLQKELKKAIALKEQINDNQIFIGNGSDEAIDLLYRIFCEPGIDNAATFTPTYGMYEVSAEINNVNFIKIPLNNNYLIDVEQSIDLLKKEERLKLVFVCSPNNPIGNVIPIDTISTIAKKVNALVVIDEAYIEFSDQESAVSLLAAYSNIVILRTFSKAYGLAGARIGYAIAAPQIIQLFNKIKPPYNVSSWSQKKALKKIRNQEKMRTQLNLNKNERERIQKELTKLEIVDNILPSNTNFLLVQFTNANQIFKTLIAHGIIVRDRTKQVTNALRITIGTPTENDSLISCLKQIKK
jgi:histidinol-phosphate aminotransferase